MMFDHPVMCYDLMHLMVIKLSISMEEDKHIVYLTDLTREREIIIWQ